ncbi:MAG: regulatory protein RecX, partial [Gemmatimonadota bacterium]
PHITRLEPLPPRGLRVRIHLDRGDPLEVALEALERLSLGVGDPLPRNDRHHLLDADAEIRVRDAALNLLSYRARTRTELRRRLLAKGFRPARIDPCLDRLERRGLLDDAAVASAFVRDRLRHRPRGKARLTQELRAKGVDGSLAERVVDSVLEDEDVTEADLARRVVEGWLGRQGTRTVRSLASEERSPESEKARRRLYGYLARRGFRGQALGRAMALAKELARA